jgi:hypothetical protein
MLSPSLRDSFEIFKQNNTTFHEVWKLFEVLIKQVPRVQECREEKLMYVNGDGVMYDNAM